MDNLAKRIAELNKNETLVLTEVKFIDEIINNERNSVIIDISSSIMVDLSCSNSILNKMDLHESQIFSSTFRNVQFKDINFSKADIWNCKFINCKFINCSFYSAELSKLIFNECVFEKTNLTYASFFKCKITKLTLVDNICLGLCGSFEYYTDQKSSKIVDLEKFFKENSL